MFAVELHSTGPVAYREAGPDGAAASPALVCIHGYPESSRMWIPLLEGAAAKGHRAVAPDLYGLGDSTDFGPATFENSCERFSEWIDGLDLAEVVLVVHDWGGFIGLSWACDNPDRLAGLVISDAGFFSDGRWHGMGEALRSAQGEELVAGMTREGFGQLLNSGGQAFDEADLDAYWAPFADGRGQRTTLDFYRSMDFDKLARWDGKLAELGVPTLLLWGAEDPFATMAAAKRFEREIPGARLVAIEGAGHFVYDVESQRCVDEVLGFVAATG